MAYFTYILQSEASGMIYIGSTNNLEDRIARHNAGRNLFTRNKGPWKMIFSREFTSRQEAVQLELMLKSFKRRDRLIRWIEAQPG